MLAEPSGTSGKSKASGVTVTGLDGQMPVVSLRAFPMAEQSHVHLRRHLMKLGPGNIEGPEKREVECLLAACWSDIDLPNEGGMAAYKLHDRTEDLHWSSPHLSFTIERHGPSTLGSVYAPLQTWVVDVTTGSVCLQSSGKRLIDQKAEPLKVGPLVEKVMDLVRTRATDPRLSWQSPNRVRVMIGIIIPSKGTASKTVQGRRRRFSTELGGQMRAMGWEKVPKTASHTYSRST